MWKHLANCDYQTVLVVFKVNQGDWKTWESCKKKFVFWFLLPFHKWQNLNCGSAKTNIFLARCPLLSIVGSTVLVFPSYLQNILEICLGAHIALFTTAVPDLPKAFLTFPCLRPDIRESSNSRVSQRRFLEAGSPLLENPPTCSWPYLVSWQQLAANKAQLLTDAQH